MSEFYSKLYSYIDLTSLNEADNSESITALCQNAKAANVAAVCVAPRFVKQVAADLTGTTIKIATVANFPGGTDELDSVLNSIQLSLEHGAMEIDVVFPYAAYLAGHTQSAIHFITRCKQACGADFLLKVILETGAITNTELLSVLCRDVLIAGADFLKTSTGKIPVGATLDAAKIMLQALKNTDDSSLGFKASGGIRSVEQAIQYVQLAEDIMGKEWVSPAHFRIGASQLPSSNK